MLKKLFSKMKDTTSNNSANAIVKAPIKGKILSLEEVPDETFASKMLGDGFEALVNTGDRVKEGQNLIRFNIDKVKENAKSVITPVVITNSFEFNKINTIENGLIETGDDLIKLYK